MALGDSFKYIHLKNPDTGQVVKILNKSKKEMAYRRLAQGFLNFIKYEVKRPFIKHVTLTQKRENYKPRILDDFRRKLKSRYGKIYSLWVVEVQKERLARSGEAVIHWHMMLVFAKRVEFGKKDVLAIQKMWKYGNVDIKPVRKASVSYLMKYIGKAFKGGDFTQVEGARRVGASRFSSFYKQSEAKIKKAWDFFKKIGREYTEMVNDYYWENGKCFVQGIDGTGRRSGRVYLYKPARWEFKGFSD